MRGNRKLKKEKQEKRMRTRGEEEAAEGMSAGNKEKEAEEGMSAGNTEEEERDRQEVEAGKG